MWTQDTLTKVLNYAADIVILFYEELKIQISAGVLEYTITKSILLNERKKT